MTRRRSARLAILATTAAVALAATAFAGAGHDHAPSSVPVHGSGFDHDADRLATALAEAGRIPAAPAEVEDLRFSEIYASPLGPRGLELTPRAAGLSGKRVRMLGFMVRTGQTVPGIALLAPFALQTHEDEYGLCDDLPAATVFVVVPRHAGHAVPYTPGPLLLTGRFETTPREEADGRVSHLRLILDEEPAATTANAAAANGVVTGS